MYFGRIPRFSPSFSPAEAAIAARHFLGVQDDAGEVARFEARFAAFTLTEPNSPKVREEAQRYGGFPK